jgi:hypothetical protein
LCDGLVIDSEDPNANSIELREFRRHLEVVEAFKRKPILQGICLLLDGIELTGRRFGSRHCDLNGLVREGSGAAEKHPNEQTDKKQKADANGVRMLADRSPSAVLGREARAPPRFARASLRRVEWLPTRPQARSKAVDFQLRR